MESKVTHGEAETIFEAARTKRETRVGSWNMVVRQARPVGKGEETLR